jgi:hypothetical protein
MDEICFSRIFKLASAELKAVFNLTVREYRERYNYN